MARQLAIVRFVCEQRSRPQKVLDDGDKIRKLDGERVKMVGLVLSLDSYGDRQLAISNAPHIPFCLPSGPKRFLELNF